MSALGQYGPELLYGPTGDISNREPIIICLYDSSVRATIYGDSDGLDQLHNPMYSGFDGVVVFYALPGQYDLIQHTGFRTTVIVPVPV